MFYDNLIKLCSERNIKVTPTILNLGFTKGALTGWKNGAAPNIDAIKKLSEFFNVSSDYFIFGSCISLSETEKELLSLYRQLSDEQKGELKYLSLIHI